MLHELDAVVQDELAVVFAERPLDLSMKSRLVEGELPGLARLRDDERGFEIDTLPLRRLLIDPFNSCVGVLLGLLEPTSKPTRLLIV